MNKNNQGITSTYWQSPQTKNPSLMVAVAIGEMNEAELLLSTGTGENEQNQNSPALEKGSVLLLHLDLQNIPKQSENVQLNKRV
jgi:hypothetical protein